MHDLEFKIINLNCEACVKLSKSVLEKIPGVLESDVDLASGLVKIKSERAVSMAEIREALKKVDKEVDLL